MPSARGGAWSYTRPMFRPDAAGSAPRDCPSVPQSTIRPHTRDCTPRRPLPVLSTPIVGPLPARVRQAQGERGNRARIRCRTYAQAVLRKTRAGNPRSFCEWIARDDDLASDGRCGCELHQTSVAHDPTRPADGRCTSANAERQRSAARVFLRVRWKAFVRHSPAVSLRYAPRSQRRIIDAWAKWKNGTPTPSLHSVGVRFRSRLECTSSDPPAPACSSAPFHAP